jgi:hypothetical protein
MNVQKSELGGYSPVSDLLVLAAVERSRRHDTFTSRRQVAHHLGFKHRAATTRGLRPQLEALREAGSLAMKKQSSGREVWLLTPRGTERLTTARRDGDVERLPESPQHREWRHARETAEAQIAGIRRAATATVVDAHSLLTAGPDAPRQSTPALELSERMHWQFWRLGTALYCLEEWPEPVDGQRDEDPVSTPGPFSRRNYRLLKHPSFNAIGESP